MRFNANKQYPIKRRQALLGSNQPRDNRMQVALNNAQGEAGIIVSFSGYYLSLPAHAL